jgi:hypothetical protein
MLKRYNSSKPVGKKKGQSTVEYIILVATIIAALIIFLRPSGPFQNAYNRTLTSGTNGMEFMANVLANSRFINTAAN